MREGTASPLLRVSMEGLHQRKVGQHNPEPSSSRKNSEADHLLKPAKHRSSAPRLSSTAACDAFILIFFTVSAIATRFYRLDYPAAVVFDELHFSKFVDRILTHTWFFDIHPPLGKLILAYVSFFLGYRPDPDFVIEKIGHEYPVHMNYVVVRAVSASFSVGTVPLTYLVSRKLGLSPISSSVATTSVLLDFLGIIEGRLILMDSQLLFFSQLSLYCALFLWRSEPGTHRRTMWLILTGLACGTALSIKHTALGTPGLIALISFFGLHFTPMPLSLRECLCAGFSGLGVYTATFYVMFNTLWKTGAKYDNFMPMHFKRTLVGSDHYNATARRVSFPRLFLYLNRRMLASNASIKKRHSWESDWYHWIANWRGVLYFVKKYTHGSKELKEQIYLLGNPVCIYLTLVSVCLFVVVTLFSVRYRYYIRRKLDMTQFLRMRSNGVFLLSGWLCNLLPYILVDRAAFLYHYIPGLFYGQLLTAVVMDMIPPKVRSLAGGLAMAFMFAAYVYWAPWIYAFPLTKEQHDERRWLPRWT